MSEGTARFPTEASQSVLLPRPDICAGQQDLSIISGEAWGALSNANKRAYMFLHSGVPARMVPTADGQSVAPQVFKWDTLRYELARAASWYSNTSNGPKPAMPPKDVVHDMLAHPDPPLPRLVRFTSAPVFVPGPRLLKAPGYDPKSQTYNAQQACLDALRIPKTPTAAAVDRAKAFILEDLLGDFPFVADSDCAHAVSLQLQPFVRPLIAGLSPLYVVEKPVARTGAGLLVDVLLFPATGSPTPVMTLGHSEDEVRRTLTARLLRKH